MVFLHAEPLPMDRAGVVNQTIQGGVQCLQSVATFGGKVIKYGGCALLVTVAAKNVIDISVDLFKLARRCLQNRRVVAMPEDRAQNHEITPPPQEKEEEEQETGEKRPRGEESGLTGGESDRSDVRQRRLLTSDSHSLSSSPTISDEKREDPQEKVKGPKSKKGTSESGSSRTMAPPSSPASTTSSRSVIAPAPLQTPVAMRLVTIWTLDDTSATQIVAYPGLAANQVRPVLVHLPARLRQGEGLRRLYLYNHIHYFRRRQRF